VEGKTYMETPGFVVLLLEEYWTEECDAVGPTNVQDIAEGDVNFKPSLGSSNIELVAVLTILAAASTFIKNTIEIAKELKKERGEKPKPTDIEEAMTEEKLEPDEIDRSKRVKVYEAVSNKLEADTNFSTSSSEEDVK